MSPARPDAASMLVRTPCGQMQCTASPRWPYVAASHSAYASAPCLVTEYGAAPSMVSSPAADAVTTKQPRPRPSQPGRSSREARTWAITLSSQDRCQDASGASGPVPSAIPALEQKMSISPRCLRAPAMSSRTPSSVATSPGTAYPPISSATAAAAAASRSLTTTRPPPAASLRARARPIPAPPPVTTTPDPSTIVIRAPTQRQSGDRKPQASSAGYRGRGRRGGPALLAGSRLLLAGSAGGALLLAGSAGSAGGSPD